MTGAPCEIGVLFADVSGSVRLYETHGDEISLAAVNTCFRIMTEAVAENGGSVVRTKGDEVMATFENPAAMVAAAIAMQTRIDAMGPVESAAGATKLAIRCGLHLGSAIENDRDYYGDSVNVAARMVALARAGQIITTDTVKDHLPEDLGRNGMRDLGPISVKGRTQPVCAVEILWQGTTDVTVFNLRPPAPPAPRVGLKLRYEQQAWIFDADCTSIALGRGAMNDVVLCDQQASRRHATIERRLDKWILIDHSTNGTFVTFVGEREIPLNREEVILHRPGTLCFGQRAGPANPGIRFSFL
jgi:class 3 adenylate cyclase